MAIWFRKYIHYLFLLDCPDGPERTQKGKLMFAKGKNESCRCS